MSVHDNDNGKGAGVPLFRFVVVAVVVDDVVVVVLEGGVDLY